MKRSASLQWLVYVLLVLGALVFTLPFAWMVSSSVKVDREMFTKDLKILPMAPLPMAQSPYLDQRFFDDIPPSDKRAPELLDQLSKLVAESGFEIPSELDAAVARREIAKGIHQRLSQRLPTEIWNADAQVVMNAARPLVDRQFVQQVFGQIYRYAALGSIRVRGKGIDLIELAGDVSPAQRWKVSSDAQAKLLDFNDQGKRAARLNYDFSSGDNVQLVGEFQSPIDVSEIRSIRVDIHPDDTWHNLTFTLEHGGRTYRARRDAPLANFDWATLIWQHASEDDASTKLRNWTVLDDVGASSLSDPHRIRLTLDLNRVNQATAWANKVKLNYLRTNDQIPFWRYIRVSVFLVVVNILLTLLSSSLVAYAFARIAWPGRDLLFLVMLVTMMIPTQVTMIPQFLIWTGLGAYDTLTPLWLAAAFGNAFFIFMLRQFMKGIPRDLEDAARIDGCGFLRIYWHAILPMIKPSLAAIAIMTFMGTWNDFMSPLIYIADQRLYPLAFGLYAFSVQVSNNPALSMAGSVLMTGPVIVIFFALQRYFIEGITLSGMKG